MSEVKDDILAGAAARDLRRSTYDPSMMLGSGAARADASHADGGEGEGKHF